jgi:hypothetical protein
VASLVLALFPDNHTVLRAAIEHDAHELLMGDIPAPARWRFPALRHAEHVLDRLLAHEHGLVVPEDEDQRRLDLCDWLDSYLFARRTAPRLLDADEWRNLRDEIMSLARDLGVSEEVSGMLHATNL